jgi:UDPglucose 6-dehydrogenase
MKIGIIGIGVVGSAVKNGFESIGHTTYGFDTKDPSTKIEDVLDTEVCFICVPSPSTPEGACDVTIAEQTVQRLESLGYRGLVTLKSTVVPGTTDRFSKEYKLRFAFCPEFLRERAAFTDFTENHDVCVIGVYNEDDYRLVKEAHGQLPKSIVHLTPLEAELTKYYSNIFNALRVVFANEFYEVCKTLGADYAKIKGAMVQRNNINDAYLDCNESIRGFGGACLPKDTKAFAVLVKELGLDMRLFETIVQENAKFKTTVFEGMRKD